ncbi:MAG: nitrate reductase subunit beta [Clostridia bacterium]|nr:nitrate reductase subunit beta [Clostridia bacterium]
MKIKANVSMVMHLDKCIGCHTCSVTCKNTWTNRPGTEHMWWNNVETKPGIGYPRRWEDQDRWRGGWELKKGKLQLRGGSRLARLARIFFNPDLPSLEDYGDAVSYDYSPLLDAPDSPVQPVARSRAAISGEPRDPRWGSNWEDDLAGATVTAVEDPNLRAMEEAVKFEYEQAFMMYLPRLCEHCLNPSCVASCPSGAMYKRDEDGIVLVDQEACRAWRFCVSGCPYKKVYFNWHTQRAEKCTFCFPRIEAGLTTVCSETCVGRIRFVGMVLYDADRVREAASTEDPKRLLDAQLSLFLDPNDPHVVEQALRDGIPQNVIEAAQHSPIFPLAVRWKVALPLHPEYRTLPMVWYIPPLSPMAKRFEELMGTERDGTDVLAAVDAMRIPVEYLANLLTAGDCDRIRDVLRKLWAMRLFMRAEQFHGPDASAALEKAGLSPEDARAMHRLLAVAKYEERFVIPTTHREIAENAFGLQGACGLDFAGGPGPCHAPLVAVERTVKR